MLQLNISRLTLSEDGDTFLALEKIPAMQRRRLSSIAKIALNSAIQSLQGIQVDYIVWSSQYGDEEKTLKILQDVLSDQTPSPTLFSTSVHNAVSGLYSIFCQDDTLATSLAASWSEALIEAYAYLKTHHNAKNALVIYYDQALPEIYDEYQNFKAFSLAGVVSLENANLKIAVENLQPQQSKYLEAQDFNAFWQNQNLKEKGAWVKC
ncbi:beta-ketoacyl synthase chain length factor [Acinetobacter guillouiae]|uniref:beta-ketoacyl synthase chain length factor n=1 Tax=Acinetobacter guillouiae TaxID=106649 RepID=UPI0033418BB8